MKIKKVSILFMIICVIMFFTQIGFCAKKTVAVVDFTNNTNYRIPNIGNTAGTNLSTLLVNEGQFRIVERTKLKDIMQEQEFSQSGLVNQNATAIKLGKLLGAQYIVTGSITNLDIEEKTFEGYDIESTKLKIRLESNIKMINVNTGVIELANIYSTEKSYQVADTHSINVNSKARILLKDVLQKCATDISKIGSSQKEKAKEVTVKFTSDPSGASIEVDGIYVGSTSAEIPVKKGIHVVKISMGGYESWKKKVKFYDGFKVKANLGKKSKKESEDK
ncbi:CsgG/HfaB family protein [Sporohalobacter salinus]|uniref:CsgG/HfaB family protein n=1 Tax=Sporohalobacter salinus TaxID=1494606 RepID=UPI00195F907E|nr:CsgG/HfaB family protein [Sporohalobacter salinus]MBM7622827.1 hypothetical protein [Sporohalobacter salinus]